MSDTISDALLTETLQEAEKKHDQILHDLYQQRQQLGKKLTLLENKEKQLLNDADKRRLKIKKQHNQDFDSEEKKRRVATKKARYQVLINGYEKALNTLWETLQDDEANQRLRKKIDQVYEKEAKRLATHISEQLNNATARIQAAEKVIDGPFVTFAQTYQDVTQANIPPYFAELIQRLRADLLKDYSDVCVRHDKERQQANWAANHALAIKQHELDVEIIDETLDVKHELFMTQSKIIKLNRDIERTHQEKNELQERVPLKCARDAIIQEHDNSLQKLKNTLEDKKQQRDTTKKDLKIQGREKERNMEKRLRADLKQQAEQILVLQQKKQHQINEVNARYDGPEATFREKRHQLDKELKNHQNKIRHDLKSLQASLTQAERALNQAQEDVDLFMQIASEQFQEDLHQALTSWLEIRIDVEQDALTRQHQIDVEDLSPKKQKQAEKKHQAHMKKLQAQTETGLRDLWQPLEELFIKTRKKLKSMKKATYAKIKAQIKPLHDQIVLVMEGWARQCIRAMKQAYKPFYNYYDTELKSLKQERETSRKSETEKLGALIEAHEHGVAELKTHIEQVKETARAEHDQLTQETMQSFDEAIDALEQKLKAGLEKIKPQIAPYEAKLETLENEFNDKMKTVLKPFEQTLHTLEENYAQHLQKLMAKKKHADETLADTSKIMRKSLQKLEATYESALENNQQQHDKAYQRFASKSS